MTVLLIAQTLRIGGIERNTLDQAYALADKQYPCKVLILDKKGTSTNRNFYDSEIQIIKEKNLQIEFANGSNFNICRKLWAILSAEDIELVIDNTLKGTLFCRIMRVINRKEFMINCVIQQLASLSAPGQRRKRMLFAQFADNLIINTINYADDWKKYVNLNYFYRVVFRKKSQIIRNGVYFPRLPFRAQNIEFKSHKVYRFIFLGRLKEWKGYRNLISLDELTECLNNFLLYIPEINPQVRAELIQHFGSRLEIIEGKTLLEFIPSKGDIHVYPVDYGAGFKFVESIATNCLEMAVMGIPSFVTAGGKSNWPELTENSIVQFVKWNDQNSLQSAFANLNSINLSSEQFKKILNQISIDKNLESHYKSIF